MSELPRYPKITLLKKLVGQSTTFSEFSLSYLVPFPDGKKRVFSCTSGDRTLRILTLDGKCEDSVCHYAPFRSLLFLEKTSQLLTTDLSGFLCVWIINRRQFHEKAIENKRIHFMRKFRVVHDWDFRIVDLWKLTQVSDLCFMCGTGRDGDLRGRLYQIEFISLDESGVELKSCDLVYRPSSESDVEPLRLIHQPLMNNNFVLFCGTKSNRQSFQTIGSSVKKLNWTEKKLPKTIEEFPRKETVFKCISSFITRKNEEIIVTGTNDGRIFFWSINGVLKKELIVPKKASTSFILPNRENETLIIGIGSQRDESYVVFLELKNEHFSTSTYQIHSNAIFSMRWLDDEETKFVATSLDRTLSIHRIDSFVEKRREKVSNRDTKERASFLREFDEYYFEMKKACVVRIQLGKLKTLEFSKIFVIL